jgi:hypothetical protein
MLDVSNPYCYHNATDSCTDDEVDSEAELTSTHFPSHPCVVMVVNEGEYADGLSAAVERLKSDGVVVNIANPHALNVHPPSFSSASDVASVIKKIRKRYIPGGERVRVQ